MSVVIRFVFRIASIVFLFSIVSCGGDDDPVVPAEKPTISSFMGNPAIIASGGSSKLTPIFQGGTGDIDNGIGMVSSNVSVIVSPAVTTTYLLTVSEANNAVDIKSLTITVSDTPLVGKWSTGCYVNGADSVIESFNFVDQSNLESTVSGYTGTICAGTPVVETRKATYQLGNTIKIPDGKDVVEIDMVITEVDGVAVPVDMQDTYYQIIYIYGTSNNQMTLGIDDPVKDGSTPALRPDMVDTADPFIHI